MDISNNITSVTWKEIAYGAISLLVLLASVTSSLYSRTTKENLDKITSRQDTIESRFNDMHETVYGHTLKINDLKEEEDLQKKRIDDLDGTNFRKPPKQHSVFYLDYNNKILKITFPEPSIVPEEIRTAAKLHTELTELFK